MGGPGITGLRGPHAAQRGDAILQNSRDLTGAEVSGNVAVSRKAPKKGAEQIDNAAFVITHDFRRHPRQLLCPGHARHRGANVESCFLVGDAPGKGMVELLQARTQE